MLLTQAVPGALGLALRKICYPWLLGALRPQRRVRPERRACGIRTRSRSATTSSSTTTACSTRRATRIDGIRIGSGVFVGRNTILSCKNGDIEIADGANIGFNCEIFSASRVRVGRDTLVAAYAYLVGGDHDVGDRSPAGASSRGGDRPASTSATAPGLAPARRSSTASRIGDRAVVGAGAVVRDDVPAGATAVGVPRAAGRPRAAGDR